MLRSRAFLDRTGKASLFRTLTQSFYFDQERPQGLVRFPSQDGDTLGGSSHGMIFLTDETVQSVAVRILDTNAANDSAANGNGAAVWAQATAASVPVNAADTGLAKEWRLNYAALPASGRAVIQVRLRELSSQADDTLSDEAGWFTTLTRTVNTGFPVNYGIAFPAADGDVVSGGYVAKVVIDKSIGAGRTDAALLAEFRVFIASRVSGQAVGELELAVSAPGILRNETGSQDALGFTLPDLYNGQPEFLHRIRVVHTRGDVSMEAVRLVRAAPGVLADSDGDGLPDYWENLWQLNPASGSGTDGAAGDPDGDGADNLTEYYFGTSPQAGGPAGTPALTWVRDTAPEMASLTFPASAARRYQVQISPDLTNWSPAGPEITPVADTPAFEWTDPAPTLGRRFYRVAGSLR